MKRLTRRIVSNEADCAYCTDELYANGKCKPGCSLRKEQLEKLAQYEDAEKDGRIIVRTIDSEHISGEANRAKLVISNLIEKGCIGLSDYIAINDLIDSYSEYEEKALKERENK